MVYMLIAAGFGLAGYLLACRHSLAMCAAERRGWDNGYAQAQREERLRAGTQRQQGTQMELLYGQLLSGTSDSAQPDERWISAYHPGRLQVPSHFYEELQKNGRAVWRRNGK